MIKIGMIGTGIISDCHFRAISELSDVCLVAISEINEDRAREVSARQNVPYYLDYKLMCINEDIDAVIINLPHFLHTEASIYCLNRGIHVLCEKPMANSVAECELMINASKKNNAKLAIGHIQRFFPSNIIVKEFIDNKKLGKLTMVNEVRNEFYFSESRPGWFLKKELSGGGIVMNFAAHSIDKVLSLVGGEITNVSASCGNIYNDYDVEGHAQINFNAGEVPCSVSLCGYKTYPENVTIYTFTDGAIRVRYGSVEIYNNETKNFEEYKTSAEYPYHFTHQLSEFIKLIRDEENISTDGYYSKTIIETIEKIYASSGIN